MSKIDYTTRTSIPYEDASKLYTVAHYFSFQGLITRDIALRLLEEHENTPWTTEMFSWLSMLLTNLLIEIEDSTKYKHILYEYPELLPIFRAYNSISPKVYDEEFRQDFPALFEDYTPTLAERILFSLNNSHITCPVGDKEIVDDYYLSWLLPITKTTSLTNIDEIYLRLESIRDCGISEENFQKYLKENWEKLFYVLHRNFLATEEPDYETIGYILSMRYDLKLYGSLVVNYGVYARIANMHMIMSYLLNIPLNVSLPKQILLQKLDLALSDFKSHQKSIISHNKSVADKLIQDCGIPIKNCIPKRMYKYPTCELVFRIKDRELTCYSRLELKEIDTETEHNTYLQLCILDSISPVNEAIYKEYGFDLGKLFYYYSRTDFLQSYIEEVEKKLNCQRQCCN